MERFTHRRRKMESILASLNLSGLINSFCQQKITPDIVCKLSRYDFLSLGVSDQSDMMKLRTARVNFGSKQPVKDRQVRMVIFF